MTFDCSNTLCKCQAGCCGIVTLDKGLVEKHKDKFQAKYIEKVETSNTVYFQTEDDRCIFLNRETKRCMIYDERPMVCRLFGTGKDENGQENVLLYCPHIKPNGQEWSEAKAKHLQRRINQVMKESMKQLSKRYKDNEKEIKSSLKITKE